MKTKLFLFLFLTVALCGANAQGTSDVYRYFADGIDEAVAASKTVVEETDEEKTNFVYYYTILLLVCQYNVLYN